MTTVQLHYWAGARAAAGVESEQWAADSIAAALAAACAPRDERFARVLSVCSLLVDGVVVRSEDLDAPLPAPVVVEILPPFAGGDGRTAWSTSPVGGLLGGAGVHDSDSRLSI